MRRRIDPEKVRRFARRALQDGLFAAGLAWILLAILEPATAAVVVGCLIFAEVGRGMKP